MLLANILLQCVHDCVLEESGDEPTSLSVSLSVCLSLSLSLQDQPAKFAAESFPVTFVIDSFNSLLNI